jgi:hypothetical protein
LPTTVNRIQVPIVIHRIIKVLVTVIRIDSWLVLEVIMRMIKLVVGRNGSVLVHTPIINSLPALLILPPHTRIKPSFTLVISMSISVRRPLIIVIIWIWVCVFILLLVITSLFVVNILLLTTQLRVLVVLWLVIPWLIGCEAVVLALMRCWRIILVIVCSFEWLWWSLLLASGGVHRVTLHSLLYFVFITYHIVHIMLPDIVLISLRNLNDTCCLLLRWPTWSLLN